MARRTRRRRRNVLKLKSKSHVGWTHHPRAPKKKGNRRRKVYKGTAAKRRRRRNPLWTSVKESTKGKKRSAHFRKYSSRPTSRSGKAIKRSRGRYSYPKARRRRNAGGKSRAARSRAAKLGWRRRKRNSAKRSSAARRGARRRNTSTRRRRTTTARRRRRNTSTRRRRTTTRRRRNVRRRRNSFVASLPRPLQPIAKAVVPSLFAIAGLATGHAAASFLASKAPADWNPKIVSVGSAAVSLGIAAAVLPRFKMLKPEHRNALLLGFGINFGLKILGALLPADHMLASFLLGVPTVASGGYYGFGQPDIYGAGMMGSYGTQYAPIQGHEGIGAYISDDEGVDGLGAYLQSPGITSGVPVQEAVAGFGAYLQEPGVQSDIFVQEAAAGWGGFGGFGDTESFAGGQQVDSHMSGLGLDDTDLSEIALDAAEAGVEGLGALHNSLQAQGGKLLYSTEEGAGNLARAGYDVRAVKNSVRHPGVPVVAAVPAGKQYQCPHCNSVGKAPSGAPVFRCWKCQQAVSASGFGGPQVATGAGSQTPIPNTIDRSMAPAPSQMSGGMVGRQVPSNGVFSPLYSAG